VLVIVDLTSPAAMWRGLGDGYRLDASFVLWEGKEVLQVPASAIFRKGERWALYAIDATALVPMRSRPATGAGLAVEILSGIDAGTPVIAHPDDTIRDGVRVEARK